MKQKERVPLQKADRTAKEERVPPRTAKKERVKEQHEFLETSEGAGASLAVARRGVAECTSAETSKPADATLEGAMKGTECTFAEKSKGSAGPLNEDSTSPRKEEERRRGSPQR